MRQMNWDYPPARMVWLSITLSDLAFTSSSYSSSFYRVLLLQMRMVLSSKLPTKSSKRWVVARHLLLISMPLLTFSDILVSSKARATIWSGLWTKLRTVCLSSARREVILAFLWLLLAYSFRIFSLSRSQMKMLLFQLVMNRFLPNTYMFSTSEPMYKVLGRARLRWLQKCTTFDRLLNAMNSSSLMRQRLESAFSACTFLLYLMVSFLNWAIEGQLYLIGGTLGWPLSPSSLITEHIWCYFFSSRGIQLRLIRSLWMARLHSLMVSATSSLNFWQRSQLGFIARVARWMQERVFLKSWRSFSQGMVLRILRHRSLRCLSRLFRILMSSYLNTLNFLNSLSQSSQAWWEVASNSTLFFMSS